MSEARELVTQDNALVNASYTLDLIEKRVIALAIARSRKTGKGITSNDFLEIEAKDYAKSFNVEGNAAYKALKEATENLFERYFVFEKLGKNNKIETVKSRWVSVISYQESQGFLKLVFAPTVIPLISELEKRFTSYYIDEISDLSSVYAVRLYELLMQWKTIGQTPLIELEDFKLKMGLGPDSYPRMNNFKSKVLDVAVNQINERTSYKLRYEQKKRGRRIVGFQFFFYEREYEPFRDPDTIDWVDGKNDNQKTKRKSITKKQAESMAKDGESWKQLLNRLKGDYFITDL